MDLLPIAPPRPPVEPRLRASPALVETRGRQRHDRQCRPAELLPGRRVGLAPREGAAPGIDGGHELEPHGHALGSGVPAPGRRRRDAAASAARRAGPRRRHRGHPRAGTASPGPGGPAGFRLAKRARASAVIAACSAATSSRRAAGSLAAFAAGTRPRWTAWSATRRARSRAAAAAASRRSRAAFSRRVSWMRGTSTTATAMSAIAASPAAQRPHRGVRRHRTPGSASRPGTGSYRSSGGPGHQSGTIATTRAGAALAPTIRRGKQATWNPVGGSDARLTSRSIWE